MPCFFNFAALRLGSSSGYPTNLPEYHTDENGIAPEVLNHIEYVGVQAQENTPCVEVSGCLSQSAYQQLYDF